MKMKALLSTIIMVLALTSLTAAPYYDTGSQIFSIIAGTTIPLSATYFDTEKEEVITKFGPGEGKTNLKMGGYGALDYEVFVNPYLSMGGELGYQFNYAMDGKIFSCVPILYRLTYVPVQGTVDIPLSLGLGFNYMSYSGNSKFTLMAHLNAGIRYHFNESWGLGIQTGMTWSPEWYSNKTKNGHITFVPINLAVSYRK